MRYLSKDIQNALIHNLAHKLENTLVAEVNNAAFLALIMDTTQDIAKIDQLSIVIRYVKVKAV